LGDGRQVQHLEATLLLQVTGEIILMRPLHNQNDTRRGLVVSPRKQCRAIPFDHPGPHRLRHGIAKLERIIDDDQVTAEPGERPINRSGDPLAPLGGDDLAVSVARKPHRRESGLVDWMVDQQAEVIGMGACEKIRVGHNNDPLAWVTPEKPGRQRHRCTE
jgi:hypothetical protein